MEQEGGLSLLDEIINRNVPSAGQAAPAYPKVIELAYIVRENVNRFAERGRGGEGGAVRPADQAGGDEALEFDG